MSIKRFGAKMPKIIFVLGGPGAGKGNLFLLLTLIGKCWKTRPEFFSEILLFCIMSKTVDYCITGKFIHFIRNFNFVVMTHELDRVLLENSSRHACITPKNSKIDDWMCFSVKRSGS